MAFDLGSIIAHIKADASDFNKGIDQAKAKADGFAGRLRDAQGASTAFAAGLAAVGAGLGAVAGFAINSAAKLEQTSISFKALLGSGEAANKMMLDLSKMAASTPFEFPELAKSARLLLAFGDSAEEVLPHLTIIGDAVSTFGGGAFEIDRVTRAIGQMAAKGKITAEEMNQLSEVGINGFKLLAEATGKTEAELREMSAAGELMAKDMLPKLYDQMQKNYGGGMALQSKTLIGLIATLKDEVGFFVRELVGFNADGSIVEGGVFDKVREAAQGFVDWLAANKGAIKQGLSDALGFIKEYAPVIVGVIVGMLIPAFIAAGVAVGGFIAAMWPFVAAGAAVGAAFMLLQPHFGTIATWINTHLMPIWQIMVQKFNEFAAVVMPIVSAAITGFIPFILMLVDKFKEFGLAVLPMIQAAIAFLAPAFAELWTVISTQLWPALQNLFNALVSIWQQVAPVLLPVLQFLGVVLGVVIVGAIHLVVTAFSFVISIVSSVINALAGMKDFFAMVINIIIGLIGFVGGVIGAVFTAAFAIVFFLLNSLGATFAAIFNTILNLVRSVLWAISTLWQGLVGLVSGVLNTIVSIVTNLMQGNVKGAFEAAINGVKSLWSGIVGFFKGIVDGVIGSVARVGEGIVAPFRDAVNKIKGLMDGAKSALANLNPFQRHSPSIVDWVKRGTKVIAGEYDDMANSISAGMIGVRQQTIGTSRTMSNVSVAAVAAESAGYGAANNNGGGSVTINLTGVLADSPEAKRRFGLEIVDLVNDTRKAKGKAVI